MNLSCDCPACQAYATTRQCTCAGPRPCAVCAAYTKRSRAAERLPDPLLVHQERSPANRWDPQASLAASRAAVAETESRIATVLAEREGLPPQTLRNPWTTRLTALRRNRARQWKAVQQWESKIALMTAKARKEDL